MMRQGLIGIVFTAAIALPLAAQSATPAAKPKAHTPAAAPKAPPAPGPRGWVAGTTVFDDITVETGTLAGANFRIDFPKDWKKCLVISNHGYSPEPRDPAKGAPAERTKMFAKRGCAVAASSYSKGGWAIENAMTDNENLRKYFVRKHGATREVFSTGGAMGAAVTMTSLELYPNVYAGGLITCCGTMTAQMDQSMQGSFRMMALFDYYFPGVLPPPVGPLNGFMYGGDTDRKVQAALDANPQKAEIFRRTTGRRMEHLANHVTFQTYINHEYQERAGGLPFDNSTYIYTLDDDPATVNAGVKRYTADPKAMKYARKWYTPTGDLKKPLFIMSPVYDPVVTINNTAGYVDVVRRAGHMDKVVFQWYDHEGHGAVSPAEVESAFDALLAWSRGGPQPPSGHGVNRGTATGAMGIGAPGPAGAAGRGGAGRGPAAPGRGGAAPAAAAN